MLDNLLTSASRKLRRAWLWSQRRAGRLTLSQRFFPAAVTVVAIAMAVLGSWTSFYLQSSITQGVATTAASSFEALIVGALDDLSLERPLGDEDQQALDQAFLISSDADSTRLLQIRIRDLGGAVVYEALGGLNDSLQPDDFEQAASGQIRASVRDVELEAVPPFQSYALPVLKIYTPLHRPGSGEVFAVAALYYSAKSLIAIQQRAQWDVWLLVGAIGLLVVVALYALVDRASRTIVAQRTRLAANLAASKRLSEENSALHEASELLRLSAISSNEALLNQVGADIHDGPMQLLTLVILHLSRTKSPGREIEPGLAATAKLATEAIGELRRISTGLVLPEIAQLDIPTAIQLAINRHEASTGTRVESAIGEMPEVSSAVLNTCVYRVVQEALNNAFRHGSGVGQHVGANVNNDNLYLSISNKSSTDGDPLRPREGGLGLRGMQLRVDALGGDLTTSSTGGVTTVTARIPLAPSLL